MCGRLKNGLAGFAGRVILVCVGSYPYSAMAQQPADWQACNIADPSAAAAKIAGCTSALAGDGQSPWQLAFAFGNRALAYTWQNDTDRAIADFSEAIRIDPDLPNWRYARAMQYEKKGQYQLALADLNAAIRLRPGTAEYVEAARRVQAAVAAMPQTAPAQSATVEDVFKKYDLLGIFAQDCSQPVSETNGYAVYRAIDDNHVQRDLMTSPTTSVRTLIADSVTEAGPNEIQAGGVSAQGWPFSYTLHVEGSRHRILTLVVHGNTIALDGILQANGKPVAWATKCNSN